MHFFSVLLECHIKTAMCPLELFMQQLGLEVFVFEEQLTFSKEKVQEMIITHFTRMQRQGCQNSQLKHLVNILFGKHFETFKGKILYSTSSTVLI